MKSTTSANQLLKLFYNATAIPNIADNAATAPVTNVAVALHSADPGAAGDQTTSEIAYTGYARATVARTTGGWTVTNNSVSPVANIAFGACTAGLATATHWSTGVAASGASTVQDRGVFGQKLGAFTAVVSGNAITIPQLGGLLAVNDRFCAYAVSGSALPAGLTEGVVYFVISVTADVITVSATNGGASITLTAPGDGICYRVLAVAISNGVTPTIANTMTTVME